MIEKLNNIYRTECVCFPRSGNTAIASFLKEYFGSDFVPEEGQTFRGTPTWNPAVNWVKNHDEGLLTTIRADRKYIVQIREPFDTLQSWYLMNQKAGYDIDIRHEFKGDKSELYDYLRDKLSFWHAWIQKWVLQRIPNRLIIQYELLTREPERVMNRVIQFLTDGLPYEDRFKIAMSRIGFWEAGRYNHFLFEEVEKC